MKVLSGIMEMCQINEHYLLFVRRILYLPILSCQSTFDSWKSDDWCEKTKTTVQIKNNNFKVVYDSGAISVYKNFTKDSKWAEGS